MWLLFAATQTWTLLDHNGASGIITTVYHYSWPSALTRSGPFYIRHFTFRHIFNSYALELREQRLTNEESIRQTATDKMASMTYPSRYEHPSRYKTHNSTPEHGYKSSQSVTGELVRWQMERAEGAGGEREKDGIEDGGARTAPTLGEEV